MAITVGSKLPAAPASVWETSPENAVIIPTSGKVVIVGVPGAFTPPCSSQVPGYISNASAFKAKGVTGIYVVAVNDVFVVEAWKKSLLAGKESDDCVHFLADSTGEYIKALGMGFDASGLLGNTRSKRFVATVEDGVVKTVVVEDEVPQVTVTAADKVLENL
ncbi:Redoxin [Tricharina praecox]|uniref:Redoxin n=1 Tax=Tricharina praecox TaxID=43433 RepID=UPI002220F668|nr:Redoxin [Tricharina praecox]KAI5850858.1 Redoxin [Tricharina praecox]